MGAYGGKASLMDWVAPAGPVYQAGTLSGNPLAVAAGLKTLEILRRPGTYERLEAISGKLASGLACCGCEGRCAAHRESCGVNVHLLLHQRSGDGLCLRQEIRYRSNSRASSARSSNVASTSHPHSSRLPSFPPPTAKPTWPPPSRQQGKLLRTENRNWKLENGK